jgi:AcrR family transcriptional regulator
MDAAAKLIAERGYHDTSMRDIAAELNMSAASLYHYFPGKEELVVALQQDCLASLRKSVDDRLRDLRDPIERLCAFIAQHMTYYVQHLSLIRVLVHQDYSLSKENREITASMKREYVDYAIALVEVVPREPDAPPLDTRVATMMLFGMMNWYYTWHHAVPRLSGRELAEHIAQIFLKGIQSRESVAQTAGGV